MAAQPKIELPKAALAAFCRKHRIRRLSLFGSVLRDDFTSGSDVDVLAEFEPGVRFGLLDLAAMEEELSRIAGHKVDLREPEEISRYFRQTVLSEALPQYVAE